MTENPPELRKLRSERTALLYPEPNENHRDNDQAKAESVAPESDDEES